MYIGGAAARRRKGFKHTDWPPRRRAPCRWKFKKKISQSNRVRVVSFQNFR